MRARIHRLIPRSGISWRAVLVWILIPAALAYFLPLAVSRMIGQDFLRAEAKAALSAALSRPVDIQGDVELTLVPWFGLRIGSVVVANDPAFGPEPLLRASSVTLEVSLPALAQKKVIVDSIALTKANLNLCRDENGRTNWRAPATDNVSAAQAPAGWTVESLPTGVRLWDAELSYTDRKTGVSVRLDRLTLNSSRSRPFAFSLSCRVAADPWKMAGELTAQGTGDYGGETDAQVFIHSSAFSGWFTLPQFAGTADPKAEKVAFSGRARVHGGEGAVKVDGLTLDGLGASVAGQVNAAGLYGESPSIALKLSAHGARHGLWTKLVGLHFEGTSPAAQDISAELSFVTTPLGWLAEKIVLQDGEGRLEGSANNVKGDVTFDITAGGMDVTPWLTAAFASPLGQGASSGLPNSIAGRVSGTDLHFGAARHIDNLEMTIQGRDGTFRLYPATVRASQTLMTADVRIAHTPDASDPAAAYDFSATARVQGLFPAASSGKSAPGVLPPALAELSLTGKGGNAGITGRIRATLADVPGGGFSPGWLTPDLLNGWGMLGASSGQAGFRVPAAGQAAWSSWELSGLSLKTAGSQVTGKIAEIGGKAVLDIQVDRLDADSLRQLAGKGGGASTPWPMDAKIAVKRLTLFGLDVDDAEVQGQTTPSGIKVSALSGTALGGKITGQAEFEDRSDRRNLSLTLAAAKIQASGLRALLPAFPKLGPLDGHVSLEASARGNAPLWQGMRGLLDVQMGRGAVSLDGEEAGSWLVNSAQTNLRFSVKPAQAQGGEQPREAAILEASGTARLDLPGMIRVTQVELKGQAGLAASGKPLWYRQPKLDVTHAVALPLAASGKLARAAWSGRFEADMEKGGVSVSGVEGNLEGIPFRGAFSARQPAETRSGASLPLAVTGTVDIPQFNPRNVAFRLGYPLPLTLPPQAWQRARFSAQLKGSLKDMQVHAIQAVLDDSAITGQIRFGGAKTRLELSADSLNFDKLFPPSEDKAPSKRPEEPLPLTQLRDLALEGTVRAGRLVRGRLTWENAVGDFTAQGGVFRLGLVSPSFYGGPYRLDVNGDARGAELKASLGLKVSGVSVPTVLRDLAGGGSFSAGTADFQIDVQTKGATDRQLRRNAVGQASLKVSDGRMGLRDRESRASASPAEASDIGWNESLKRTSSTPAPDPGMAFSRLAAAFSIRDGMAVTRDLSVTGGPINARGDGWISLDDETISLSVLADIPNAGEVPVRISGPLYDPKLDIDKAKMLEGSIVNMFKNIGRLPGNILNQLFRRGF